MYIQQTSGNTTMNLTLSNDQKRRTIYIDNMSSLALPIHLFRIYHHVFSDIEDISVKRRQDRSTQYAFIRFRSIEAINMKPDPEAVFSQREIFQQGEGCQYLLLSHKSLDNNTSTGVSVVWVLNSDPLGCPVGVSIVDVENDPDGSQILARLLSSKQKKKVQDRQEYPLVLEAQRLCSRYKWSQNGFVRPCYHYSTRNSCPAGDACGFLHDDKIYETVQMLLAKRGEQPQQRTSTHSTPSTSPQATPNASPRWSPRGFKTPPHLASPPLAPHIDRRTAMSPLSFDHPYVDQNSGSAAISSSSSLSSSPLHFSPPRMPPGSRQCMSFSNSSSPGSSSPNSSMPTSPRLDGSYPMLPIARPPYLPARPHFAVIHESSASSSTSAPAEPHLIPAQKAAESTSSFLFGSDDDELSAVFSPLSLTSGQDGTDRSTVSSTTSAESTSQLASPWVSSASSSSLKSSGSSSSLNDAGVPISNLRSDPDGRAADCRLRMFMEAPSALLRGV